MPLTVSRTDWIDHLLLEKPKIALPRKGVTHVAHEDQSGTPVEPGLFGIVIPKKIPHGRHPTNAPLEAGHPLKCRCVPDARAASRIEDAASLVEMQLGRVASYRFPNRRLGRSTRSDPKVARDSPHKSLAEMPDISRRDCPGVSLQRMLDGLERIRCQFPKDRAATSGWPCCNVSDSCVDLTQNFLR